MSEQSRFMLVASPLMENSPAFDRAAALAKAEDAALHIVAFDYLEGLATAGMVNEQALEQMRLGYVERHRQWLEEQARPLRKIGVTVTTEVVWVERPLQEILIHLKEQPMAVLIKALEPSSRLSRMMFTPLDIHLLRECQVPLHFVSHVQHALPRRIVAAVDPFHRDGQYKGLNDRILHEAVKLATACNAQVDVLYAYDLSSIGADEFGFDNASAFFSSSNAKTLFDAQGEVFNDLAERNGIPPERRHMVMGNPAKVLASYADAYNVDVIVMGRVGHNGLERLIGSTVEHLLYKMPCSVWVVAPEELADWGVS
ncbi:MULTISPECIES: universal stress protein [unclassified Pseudomonas]|uniref:universal stress protein n=1 Tax=unclassified Pseudomonas TaxID=196821 RepID=UPI000C878295|nr:MULTISPECIES: universal stress protein [unclassified Pseudomonas]PMU12674.1 universal stress protein [Pseudomonas sp. FW305-20]PMU22196.1 universal stress protein [Pseudomonas sp. FW305-122]PMU43400.1 universal stress protein [Pseudomonas sp. FW305-47B]PMX57710.1 universal stress protein [Pseudomonas sp. FW305-33]PMX64742.1 universal stress protein [Pseudomonas sp. FW305-60]